MSKLLAFDFDIEYIKGKNNIVFNALSRRPHLSLLMEITADRKEHIIAEYAKNSFASGIVDGTLHDERYKLVGNLILHKDRIFLVPKSKLKMKVFK